MVPNTGRAVKRPYCWFCAAGALPPVADAAAGVPRPAARSRQLSSGAGCFCGTVPMSSLKYWSLAASLSSIHLLIIGNGASNGSNLCKIQKYSDSQSETLASADFRNAKCQKCAGVSWRWWRG